MIYWCKSNGIKSVSFNLGAPAVSQNGSDASFTLSPDILANEAFRFFKVGKGVGIKIGFLFNIPFCILPRDNLLEMLCAGSIVSGCQIFSGSGILFDVEGNLVTCNHLLDFPTLKQKEAMDVIDSKRSFQKFWKSKKIMDLRKSACVYRSEHCQTCELWDACGGGCPIFWTCYSPEEYIKGYVKDYKGKEVKNVYTNVL